MTDYSVFNQINSARRLSPSQQQMLFQERLSNTAHVREIEDLKAAGLNPVLSAHGQGASTPTGASSDADPYVANPMFSMIKTINRVTGSSAKTAGQAMKLAEDLVKEFKYNGPAGSKDGHIVGPSNHTNSSRELSMFMDTLAGIGSGNVAEGLKEVFNKGYKYISKNVPDAKKNKNGDYEASKLPQEVYQIPVIGKGLKGMLDSVARNSGKDFSKFFAEPYPAGVFSSIGKIVNSAKKNKKYEK